MALTHRVHVAVGIHNMGFENFWLEVFEELEMSMPSLSRKFLWRKDESRKRKREYQKKTEVKRKRNRDKFEKLQTESKKIKRDAEKGLSYGSGIGLSTTIPPEVEKLDANRKEELKVKCKLPGCYTNNHIRRSSKLCTYYQVPRDEMNKKIDSRLRELFPASYGE